VDRGGCGTGGAPLAGADSAVPDGNRRVRMTLASNMNNAVPELLRRAEVLVISPSAHAAVMAAAATLEPADISTLSDGVGLRAHDPGAPSRTSCKGKLCPAPLRSPSRPYVLSRASCACSHRDPRAARSTSLQSSPA
jgi:hypothetical protein